MKNEFGCLTASVNIVGLNASLLINWIWGIRRERAALITLTNIDFFTRMRGIQGINNEERTQVKEANLLAPLNNKGTFGNIPYATSVAMVEFVQHTLVDSDIHLDVSIVINPVDSQCTWRVGCSPFSPGASQKDSLFLRSEINQTPIQWRRQLGARGHRRPGVLRSEGQAPAAQSK